MRVPVVLVAVLFLAGCTSQQPNPARSSTGLWRWDAPAQTSPPKTNQSVTVTPARSAHGKVAFVNAAGRYVVLTFPIGTLPGLEQKLNVYRQGLKVAEVKVSGPQRDFNTAADILVGECQVGDEVREN